MGKWQKSSPELIELFTNTMQNFSEAQLRKMFGYPCCFVDDKMCTGLHEENWVLRLDEEDREHWVDSYQAKPFEPMKGCVMREYLAIPDCIRQNPSELKAWIKKSIAFTKTKPTKKKKAR